MSETDVPSPTTEIVLKILEYEGPLTRKELLAETYRCETAVDQALNDLEKRGRVSRNRKPGNARQIVLEIRD